MAGSMTQTLLVLFSILSLVTGRIFIAEANAHTDAPYYDFIEIGNDDMENPVSLKGIGVSESGQVRDQITFADDDFLAPGERRSLNILAETLNQGNKRLSLQRERLWLTNLETDETLDDYEIMSTYNQHSYCRTVTSEGFDKSWMPVCWDSQDFLERYPIVGPWVISEIGIVPKPGSCQYVKVTAIHGNQDFANGANSATSWEGRATTRSDNGPWQLNMRATWPPIIETAPDSGIRVANTPTYAFPTDISGPPGTEFYVHGCPAEITTEDFRTAEGIAAGVRIVGPWPADQAIDYTTGEAERISLNIRSVRGSNHYVFVEMVPWDPRRGGGTTWPVWWDQSQVEDAEGMMTLPTQGFAIERISLESYAAEPYNWRQKGTPDQTCTTAADCQHIDRCTLQLCDNGVCRYNALSLNHSNWDECYPDKICADPTEYNSATRCDQSLSNYNKGTRNIGVFGYYGSQPEGQKFYYQNKAVAEPLVECVISPWSEWSDCLCGFDNTLERQRTREIYVDVGCEDSPVLVETEACDQDGTPGPDPCNRGCLNFGGCLNGGNCTVGSNFEYFCRCLPGFTSSDPVNAPNCDCDPNGNCGGIQPPPPAPTPTPSGCMPDEVRDCDIPNGRGQQECNADGTWSDCVVVECFGNYEILRGINGPVGCTEVNCVKNEQRDCVIVAAGITQNGTGIQICRDDSTWSNCFPVQCDEGYYHKDNECLLLETPCTDGETVGCDIPNGVGEVTCASGEFSDCVLSQCNFGFAANEAGTACLQFSCCVGDTQACGGNGEQECFATEFLRDLTDPSCTDNVVGQWGPCATPPPPAPPGVSPTPGPSLCESEDDTCDGNFCTSCDDSCGGQCLCKFSRVACEGPCGPSFCYNCPPGYRLEVATGDVSGECVDAGNMTTTAVGAPPTTPSPPNDPPPGKTKEKNSDAAALTLSLLGVLLLQ